MNRSGTDRFLGLGLVIVGVITMAISEFLPFSEPTIVFMQVARNTLIQQDGGTLIGFALAIAIGGYRASLRKRTASVVTIILCLIAAGLIILWGNLKSMRELYPLLPDGSIDTSGPPMPSNLSIAIYVAGVGVTIALVGAVILAYGAWQQRVTSSALTRPKRAVKKCPDCAEWVLSDANVCKHCGYRFAPPTKTHNPRTRTSPMPSPTSTDVLHKGDRVRVIKRGHKHSGKTGKVLRDLGTGYVAVRLGLSEAAFRPDELEADPDEQSD